MSNRWGIPKDIETLVLSRDLHCIYCRIPFVEGDPNRKTRKTWEHIVNDIRINGADNIALCCGSCNASKGNKKLQDWLGSTYCKTKNIHPDSIAAVAREHLKTITTT